MNSTSTSSQTGQFLALITGGARRLGREIALEVARQGYAIAIHYHQSEEAVAATSAEIRQMGVPVYLIRADLSDPAEIEQLFAEIASLPHPLRLLVNSAAVMPHVSLQEITVQEWDATLALNLRAPMLCSQAAARQMGEAGGLIINLTDAGAGKVWTGFPAYIISKAALESLTRLLARTLAPTVRVNAIAPGLILPSAETSDQDWQRLIARVPLKRPGQPQEIAQAVSFLIRNEYITGQILVIDGGYQMI